MSVRLLGTTRAVRSQLFRRLFARPVDGPAPGTQAPRLAGPRSEVVLEVAELASAPIGVRPAGQIGFSEAHSPVLEASR